MTKSGSSPTHAPSGGSQQDGSQAPRDGSILPIREEEAGVKTEECRGVALSELNHAPTCSAPLSKLEASRDHSLLIRPPVIAGIIPCPHPDKYHDAWDENHVRMPCSSNNLYPKTSPQRGKTLQMRWELIETVLLGNMQSSLDLEEAILVYNARYAARWTFGSLHELFTDRLSRREADDILRYTLPKMAELALQLPFVVTRPIRLLKHGCTHSLTFSQHQVACLLANAFFCTFPRRNSTSKQCEYQNFPTINFSALYSGSGHGGGSGGGGGGRKLEKLKTLLHYFRRVTRKMPTGTVTYRRQHLSNLPDWEGSTHQLPRLHLSATGKIEDEGQGMLQVDFANRWVAVAPSRGLVQEEIRFMICPEMIIARLFTEVLQPDECLVMTGCERFSSYSDNGG
ncbi:PREDICTED: poly(ADP-ribose) glycohydrolase-like isoform X2 [Priapulus caudatus]|uniref:poly(ADP-ribose) glycohydrolase n=1 Tax=Priapulus caudatus TaxID=37621 RepID=A0ABM1EN29_PRICU|nr:PREDICTED: poly(ADP-ribose) glycohydrolase-like isoform X2 [Priapulus caudatus]